MEKKFVICAASDPPLKRKRVINWNLCVLCQKEPIESLVFPARGDGVGYTNLAADLEAFHAAQLLPSNIDLEELSSGSTISQSFVKNEAKFHKNCRADYTQYKLNRKLNSASREKSKSASSQTYFTRSTEQTENKTNVCLFCESETGDLHGVETKELSQKISSFAEILQDQKVLAKLSEGDAIAIEAKYHLECLNQFCNRKRSADRQASHCDSDDDNFAIAFAELTSYVQDVILEKEGVIPVFKLKKLATLLENRLEQLTGEKKNVHTTRLKNMLTKVIPQLTAFNEGREVLLTINKGVGEALRKACKFDAEADLIYVNKFIRKIRLEALKTQSVKVCALDAESQAKSVPPLLLALVKMLLYGTNSQQQCDNNLRQEALTLAQLIHFNMKQSAPSSSGPVRHWHNLETPFPVYLSLMIHAKTRKRDLIDIVHKFGIGVSYDRVLQISSALSHCAVEHFQKAGVVCSPNLKKGFFVTGAVDNIDLNPSSTTAFGSFHGTGISLQQHYARQELITDNYIQIKEHCVSKAVPKLPSKYTSVTPLFLTKSEPQLPEFTGNLSINSQTQGINFSQQTVKWLQHVDQELSKEAESIENVTWGSFNSKSLGENCTLKHKSKSELLPMFSEVAHSPAMIAHAMKIVAETTNYLNEGQVPVITCDAPLYAIAKQLQWQIPEKFGKDKFVVMMGGLHIEKAILSTLGDLLDGSGWVETLTEAEISSSGRSQSFIQVHHIKRTRYAHQVTLCALFILKKLAYSNYQIYSAEEKGENEQLLSFEEWIKNTYKSSPQFAFWSIVMELEECLLEFLTSIRNSNFQLYITSLTKFSPWFFSFNHYNYARWLPIHLRDMVNLKAAHPAVYSEFSNGKFTANISGNKFSAMALDQAHEQCNSKVKGDGGAVGLTENPDALRRWMVAGPEVARIIQEYESGFKNLSKMSDIKDHHESSAKYQSNFSRHVRALVKTIEKAGNPFEAGQHDLQNLQNKLIISETDVAELEALRNNGNRQFENFIQTRLIKRTASVFLPLKKNQVKLFIFKSPGKNKSQLSLKNAKSDASLFARLYLVCQQRGSDLDEFFSHENQPYPPSLSDFGQIRQTKKSDLLQCLREEINFQKEKPSAPCVILDGPAVVHMHPPGESKTFRDYVAKFSDAVLNEWTDTSRIDIVWDEYRSDSLKAETRVKRGAGARRKVCLTTPVPRNWSDFLRNNENKKELFALIAGEIVAREGPEIISTTGKTICCNKPSCTHGELQPCNHEEADTRLLLHAKEASQAGHDSIIIRTVDTDVVVISLAVFDQLNVKTLWIAFGTGKNYEFIPVHQMFNKIGAEKAAALPFFHALTGSDRSSFSGHGKKTAWETLNNFSEVMPSFQVLSNMPTNVEAVMDDIERFVILLYDKTSSQSSINKCRKDLFTKKRRFFDRLPPTKAALVQHVLRSAYQAGFCWGQCLQRELELPDPANWGWSKMNSEEWTPKWSTLSEASIACRELLSCGCKNCNTKRCKCKKALMKCTVLCKCEDCENGYEKEDETPGGIDDPDEDELFCQNEGDEI